MDGSLPHVLRFALRNTGTRGGVLDRLRTLVSSEVVDVFHTEGGIGAARAEIAARRGTWFDPVVADALLAVPDDDEMWAALRSPELEARVLGSDPSPMVVDEAWLDDIATAFGEVIDAKSSFTAGHSARVALYTESVARELGLGAERRRWLARGALLHDLGKLGVSNSILDKPGKLEPAEWEAMKRHAMLTEQILGRFGPFAELARVAAAHHERLDGNGYPRGLAGDEITLETRIITVADVFDALTADRPYRAAMPLAKALGIMRESAGAAFDPDVLGALERVAKAIDGESALAA